MQIHAAALSFSAQIPRHTSSQPLLFSGEKTSTTEQNNALPGLKEKLFSIFRRSDKKTTPQPGGITWSNKIIQYGDKRFVIGNGPATENYLKYAKYDDNLGVIDRYGAGSADVIFPGRKIPNTPGRIRIEKGHVTKVGEDGFKTEPIQFWTVWGDFTRLFPDGTEHRGHCLDFTSYAYDFEDHKKGDLTSLVPARLLDNNEMTDIKPAEKYDKIPPSCGWD